MWERRRAERGAAGGGSPEEILSFAAARRLHVHNFVKSCARCFFVNIFCCAFKTVKS